MLRLTILAVGRFGRGAERALYEAYAKRIAWPLTLVEIDERRGGSDAERKARENAALGSRIPAGAAVVALDEGGEGLSSRDLAARLKGFAEAGRREVAFLIGGADGLDETLLARADLRLALGRLTWPHLLVRTMLAEQLYRAGTIIAGHPYHRD